MSNNNPANSCGDAQPGCALNRAESTSFIQRSRRGFLKTSLALAVVSGMLPVIGFAASPADASVDSPDAAAVQIAEFGKRIREIEPEIAGRLEALAREAAGLTASDKVDWQTADKARLKLTARSRIAQEWSREEVVFVDGWCLARSEAAAALLYAAAANPPA